MRETWGPVWFVSALCAIALIGVVIGRLESVAPAFFSFLPVVFYQMTRTIQRLAKRIAELETVERSNKT